LQWQIDRGAASGIPTESDPKTIAARLLVINFAAIHTSTFSITQTIFDLVASSPEVVEALREESTAALVATDNQWSKATLQLLFRHDSCLRESTRLGSFLGVGMVRRVSEPQGLTTPNGTHCPYGSWIGVASNGVHNDPAIYPESETYKPFRFYDMREADAKASVEGLGDLESTKETEREALIKKANLSFVSVSPQYHPFGHGRHACPGRFFAANELKVLLAYMMQNYEFEFLETRPPSQWMGPVLIPPRTATIRVRRRLM
jgi:cytochrome P450